jgi:hypothetical protein
VLSKLKTHENPRGRFYWPALTSLNYRNDRKCNCCIEKWVLNKSRVGFFRHVPQNRPTPLGIRWIHHSNHIFLQIFVYKGRSVLKPLHNVPRPLMAALVARVMRQMKGLIDTEKYYLFLQNRPCQFGKIINWNILRILEVG